MKADIYKFFTAVLVIFSIWGIVQHNKQINACGQKIADLEYIIQSGEHCLSVCEEKFKEWGC